LAVSGNAAPPVAPGRGDNELRLVRSRTREVFALRVRGSATCSAAVDVGARPRLVLAVRHALVLLCCGELSARHELPACVFARVNPECLALGLAQSTGGGPALLVVPRPRLVLAI